MNSIEENPLLFQTETSLKFKTLPFTNLNKNKSKKLTKTSTFKYIKPKPSINFQQFKITYSKFQDTYQNMIQFLNNYKDMPYFSKNSCLQELNSFSSNFVTQQNLFKNQKMLSLMSKLRSISSNNKSVDIKNLTQLIYLVINLQCDNQIIFKKYKQLLASSNGFSLKCMILYLGIYLYMVFANYLEVYRLLDLLRQQILINQMHEHLIVYLHIMINIKLNLNQHQQAIKYLKKIIKLSWLYNLEEIQIWSYHQMSKCYLSLQMLDLSLLMKNKFQQGIIEQKNSKYRAICCDMITLEIENIKNSRSDFLLNRQDLDLSLMKKKYQHLQLCKNQELKHFKHVLYEMAKQRKINHLNTILPRLFQERVRNKDEQQIKTVLYLTHLSKLKNFNLYFRNEIEKPSHNKQIAQSKFITIQNSNINWPILKQILRRIVIEYLL